MKHEFKVIPKEEILSNRSNAYEFIDFDKKETLEEAAKECLINNSLPTDGDFAEGYITGSLFGAKWQQERMYSEEEVETIAKDAYAMGRKGLLIGVFNKWFEQFKNK